MAQKEALLLILISGYICGIAAQLPDCEPRDVAAAGRECQRGCREDGSCRKQNRECLCDGRCGASCLRKTCPSPTVPINGSLTINPIGRFIGSEATYSCNGGYVLVGNATRICQANKTWSGIDPSCNKSLAPPGGRTFPTVCERLPPPLNGRVTFLQEDEGTFVEGTVARFECNQGYSRTSGSLLRNCQEDGRWSGSAPVCTAGVHCLRDDSEIQSQNRRCMRQCESDSDCLGERICVCDDICGWSCIRIDKVDHCEALSSTEHVRVRITPNNRTFGSIARYQCRTRRERIGGSNERRCLGSGQWSGEPLTCIPADRCHEPPVVENSVHNGTKDYYLEGEIVIYSCHSGYYRAGRLALARCNGNDWSEIEFQCSPKSCGDPGLVLNGRRHGAIFIFRGSVEYTCNPGYQLRGLPVRFCQANQQWSGSLPTCHPVRCPALGVPENGRKIGSEYSYNKIVSFECYTRYILEGQSLLRCQANGTWDAPQPTCRFIQCPRPEDPENGQSDASLQFYGYQGTIRFTCNNGYTPSGSDVITCDENEQWNPPPPLCLGQCRIPRCPTHGQWTISSNRWDNCPYHRMVNPGFELTYRCNNGYFKCQQMAPVCRDREWEPSAQNLCQPVGCNNVRLTDPRLTANYTYDGENKCFNPTRRQRGTVIQYSCNHGYTIRDGDPHQATCRSRNWSPPRQPTCVEVTCPPIQIPNGRVSYRQNGPFESDRGHTAVAWFFCFDGYELVGRTSVTCDNGVWDDTTARCIEAPCYESHLNWYGLEVEYEIPPGSDEVAQGRKPAGTRSNFVCRERGFEAIQTKTCRLGAWTGENPECSRVSCDDERLWNGEVRYTLNGIEYQNPVHGVERSFHCDVGFLINNEESSLCDAGIWIRELPVCNERPCNENDLPSGHWEIEFYYPEGQEEEAELMKPPGTVARFRCNVIGYVIARGLTKSCRQGEWVGQNPYCEKRTCPIMQLEHGTLRYRDIRGRFTSEPRHGDSRTAACGNGYSLQGTSQTLCWDGEWEDVLPICQEKPCNENDLRSGDWELEFDSPGGQNDAAELMKPPGTMARFICNATGYIIAGEDTSTCSLGEWDELNPICERRTCPTTQLEHGTLEYRDDLDGRPTSLPRHEDSRMAACQNGYDLQGTSQTLCWDGEWRDDLPTCQEKPCSKTDLPRGNWAIEFNSPGEQDDAAELMKAPGTMARFICNVTGYIIAGEDTSTCSLGEWDRLIPTCERRRCQTFQLTDRTLAYRESNDTPTLIPRHGDYRIATCEDGHNLQGISRTRCSNGEWEDELPTCQENPCSLFSEGDVPNYLQVRYQARDGSRDFPNNGSVPSRSMAIFTCLENGTRVRGDSRRTCKRGEWKGTFPQCENATCSIETIDNGDVTRDDDVPFTQEARHSEWVRFTCQEGYAIVGENRSQCIAGVWIPEKPTCEEEWCQAVENNGEYSRIYYHGTSSLATSFPPGTNLEIVCAAGRVAEARTTSVCRRGLWDPLIPRCVPAVCSIENVANGIVTRQDSSQFTQEASDGEWRRVVCEPGYTPDGIMWSQCLRGEWSETPTCVEASCHSVATNGEYSSIYYQGRLSQDTSFPPGTTLEVDCAEGRVAEGPRTSVCRRGLWDPLRLLCVEVAPCEVVTEEDGRTITYTDNSGDQKQHNSVLTVTCESHLFLRGQDTSTCMDGAWNPPVAHCKENLALGKIANQESNDFDGEANRAIDGNTNGSFEEQSCTHTSRDPHNHNPWWYVDLGSSFLVQEIVIYNRQDGDHHDRLLNAKVRVGELRGSYVTGNQLAGTIHETESNPIRIEVNPAIEGSIVSVSELDPGNALTLCEVQVFEELRACSNGCEVPRLENGYFTLQTQSGTLLQPMTCVPSGSHVIVNCHHGLFRHGDYYYTCQSPGEWRKPSGVDSKCQRCRAGHCIVPYIENGYYHSGRSDVILANGTCFDEPYLYVVCHEGMQRVGSRYYQCYQEELNTYNRDNILSFCNGECLSPGVVSSVKMFVGSDYTPLDGQATLAEGDFITSRCQDPKTQKLHGSMIRRCKGGRWSGDPVRCESTNFAISVGNTALQNVTENSTIIVYPISGYVTVQCKLRSTVNGIIRIYKDDEEMSTSFRVRGTQSSIQRLRINNPSPADSGTYRCWSSRGSHSIVILFKAITCPAPEQPDLGQWRQIYAGANPRGDLGYIFMESLLLNCPVGYRRSYPSQPQCTYHGTWSNMSQRCIR